MTEIKVKRPVLRYFGGKFRLAPHIIKHFYPHSTYVEPFAGAASVLLRKPRSNNEFLYDCDERSVRYLQAIRDFGNNTAMRIANIKPTKKNWIGAIKDLDSQLEVDFASAMLVRSFLTRGTDEIDYPSASYRKHPISIAAWKTLPDSVMTACERLRGVSVVRQDFRKTFADHDHSDTLIYCDPPYHKSTRTSTHGYRNEFTEQDHLDLLALCRKSKAKVCLSGYATELYDRELKDWNRVEINTYGDCAKKTKEILWMNY